MTIKGFFSNETSLLWESVIVMINWQQDVVPSNSIQSVIILVINKSDARLAVVRFCLSLVWLQIELDSTQSYCNY